MIEVKDLTKYYGPKPAVEGLSFTIEPGHIYGFLGPNGAGKSTTMNIITGCLAASSGEVKIGGYDIFEQPLEAKRLIGYLPEQPPLYPDQTPREFLAFVAEAKGIARCEIAEKVEKAASECGITDVLDRLIKHLSKGYCQRVGIAQALLGDPEVVILDEPTVGLDPAQIIEIRELIGRLGEGRTVIISSHILSEIQAVCDMALIISHGKLVAFDKIENLETAIASGSSIELRAEAGEEHVREILSGVEAVQSVSLTGEEDGEYIYSLAVGSAEPKQVCREISLAFMNAGEIVTQLSPKKAMLEDVFLNLTGASEEPAAEAAEADAPAEEEKTEEVSEQ